MRIFGKILKWIFYCALGMGLVFALGCFIPRPGADFNTSLKGPKTPIWVTDNGVHTSLVLPVKNQWFDWSSVLSLSQLSNRPGETEYLVFGWGDRQFYLHTPSWSDLKFSTAFNAAFRSSASILQVTALHSQPNRETMKKLMLHQPQYRALVKFIKKTFKRKDDKLQPLEKSFSYGARDQFYVSSRNYHLFYTCNSWIAEGLRKAGFKTPLIPVLSGTIMWHLPNT